MAFEVQLGTDGTVRIPGDMLESLKLEPGATLLLQKQPETNQVTLIPQSDGRQDRIYEDRGVLVYRALGTDPSHDLLGIIDEMREERMRHIMGWNTQEDDDLH